MKAKINSKIISIFRGHITGFWKKNCSSINFFLETVEKILLLQTVQIIAQMKAEELRFLMKKHFWGGKRGRNRVKFHFEVWVPKILGFFLFFGVIGVKISIFCKFQPPN